MDISSVPFSAHDDDECKSPVRDEGNDELRETTRSCTRETDSSHSQSS